MKKKIAIFLLVVLVVSAGYFVMQTQQGDRTDQEGLSARSKEYLEKRSENEETSLKFAAVDQEGKSVDEANQTLTVEKCYSITVPYRISSSRIEKDCFLHIALRSPRGTLNAYRKFEPVKTVSEIPGISMRRLYPDMYEEKTLTIGGQEYLIFRKKDEAYEKNAFLLVPGGYMIINISAGGGEELDQPFITMLASIKLNKE